jgi:DNA-binding beta-propeller fold protein YncE
MRYRHIIPIPGGNLSIAIEAGGETVKKDDAVITGIICDNGKEGSSSSLDFNSFNQSETPDFLKNINAKHAEKYKLEDEERSENKNLRSGFLDSRSFNDAAAPDFLSEIIKKGKPPLINLETEKVEKNSEPDIKTVIKPVIKPDMKLDIKTEIKPETPLKAEPEIKPEAPLKAEPEIKPVIKSKIEPAGERESKPSNKPHSFDKFKAPPRIESILKEDEESFSTNWGVGVEKSAGAPEATPAIKTAHGVKALDDKAEPDGAIEAAESNSEAAISDMKPDGEKNALKAISDIKPEVKTAPESGETAGDKLLNRRLIAVDSGNNRVQFVTADAKFISSFGTRGTGPAQFDNPQKAVIDSPGNIYISDFSNNRIQKFTSDGQFILSFGTHGGKNGEFNYPCGLAISKEGLLFVVDSYNNRVQVFDCDGKYISKFEGAEISSDAQLDTPTDIALDSANNIYVCDTGNNRVIKFDPKWRKLYALGIPDKKNQGFDSPSAIAIDDDDNLIVADTGNHLIKIFDNMGRIISNFGAKGQKEGKLDSPGAVACDEDKNIYIADTWNNRIQIFTFGGAFIRSIGSYGSDPGKFNHINDVVVVGGGII